MELTTTTTTLVCWPSRVPGCSFCGTYHHHHHLVYIVLSEIDHLKGVPEGSNKKMMDTVSTVERSWLDLKKLDKERDIENAVNLSKIERILPAS